MEKIKRFFKKDFGSYAVVACVAILFYVIINNLGVVKGMFDSVLKLIAPVLVGAVIAYLFNPIAMFFERTVFKKVKKASTRQTLSITLSVVCFLAIVALLLLALVPSLAQSIATLVSKWSGYTAKAHEIINRLAVIAESRGLKIDFQFVTEYLNNWSDKLISLLKDNSKEILSTVGDIGTGLSNVAVGVLFGICFMFMKKSFSRFVSTLRGAFLNPERIERTDKLLSHCNEVFLKYVGSTLLDAFIIGIATLIFAVIMKMPYAPLLAVIAATTNIIPTFGPMIGTALGMFFLVLDNPKNALWLLIFHCILQALDGMVIKPNLFKGSLGLPAAMTLVLIFLGGKIAGMAGIILSIPFGAIFLIIWRETLRPYLFCKKNEIEKEYAITPSAEESAETK